MQNSLDRLFEGIALSLREAVLPAVDDPYARSQVAAAIELVGNLGARVQWRSDQIEALIDRIRVTLGQLDIEPPELTGDAIDDRRNHLAALAQIAGSGEVPDVIQDLLVWELENEFDRLKTGMYK
jgi:hypothetical protein